MPRYKIEIDAPDAVLSIPELDDLADKVYDLLADNITPGSDCITVEAMYD